MSNQSALQIAQKARAASRILSTATNEKRVAVLNLIASKLSEPRVIEDCLQANQKDLEQATKNGRDAAYMDRLRLTKEQILGLSKAVTEVAKLPDPVGSLEEKSVRPSGITVARMLIPLGVVLVIYEARPGVSIESAALCIMSGNAVLLRGASDSQASNNFLISIIRECLAKVELPEDCVISLAGVSREELTEYLSLDQEIDLVIPRGGADLVRSIKARSRIAVLAHAEGVCHVYIHSKANYDKAERIILNSKLQRYSVCNAAECMLLDSAVAEAFLPPLAKALEQGGAELRVCEKSFPYLKNLGLSNLKQAELSDFGKEFLSPCLAIKVVDGLDDALDFIAKHGSQHTEAIVTEDRAASERFLRSVRASCVTVNASTRFNDGGQLGLGAEIGISTTPLHAFGPMGLKELCARKFVVIGDGSIRQ